MIASVRFWRALLPHLPETETGDCLWAKIICGPDRQRKRHMPARVDLTTEERAIVDDLMWHPPTLYLAFVRDHHLRDALTRERAA